MVNNMIHKLRSTNNKFKNNTWSVSRGLNSERFLFVITIQFKVKCQAHKRKYLNMDRNHYNGDILKLKTK